MAADGEDFTRRKKLYGVSYRLSKEGRELTEIAPALVKGWRLEIKSRPLHAFKPVCMALESLANGVHDSSSLLSSDMGFNSEAFQRELSMIGAIYNAHDSTRHILDAADRLKEQIIQGKIGKAASLDQGQISEMVVLDLFRQLAVSPMEDYHAFHRHLTPEQCKADMAAIEHLAADDLRELARDVLNSPTGRRSKVNVSERAIDYSAESLESEVLAP